jgi:probable metal-binding protein
LSDHPVFNILLSVLEVITSLADTEDLMESIHGHELMHWLGANGPIDRASLLARAGEVFGNECRFHTCSMEGLSAAALVDFLVGKGKIAEESGALRLAMPPCDH